MKLQGEKEGRTAAPAPQARSGRRVRRSSKQAGWRNVVAAFPIQLGTQLGETHSFPAEQWTAVRASGSRGVYQRLLRVPLPGVVKCRLEMKTWMEAGRFNSSYLRLQAVVAPPKTGERTTE